MYVSSELLFCFMYSTLSEVTRPMFLMTRLMGGAVQYYNVKVTVMMTDDCGPAGVI